MPGAPPDRDAGPDQGSHHGVAEGVGLHRQGDQSGVTARVPGGRPPPLQAAQGADGRGAGARPAVGQEVVLSQQRRGRCRHGVDVEAPGLPQDLPAAGGIARRTGVGDPVDVAAADGGEPGVEGGGHHAGAGDRDVRGAARRAGQAAGLARQDPGQAGEQGGPGGPVGAPRQPRPGLPAHVQVRHLGGGVHASVGAARHRQPDGRAQDRAQGVGQDALDGAQARLRGPAAEGGAVVGQVQAQAEDSRVPLPRSAKGLGHRGHSITSGRLSPGVACEEASFARLHSPRPLLLVEIYRSWRRGPRARPTRSALSEPGIWRARGRRARAVDAVASCP